MQELLLFSSIPASRHTQLLNILSGISAMQPVPITEQTLLYRQLHPTPTTTKSKSTSTTAASSRQQQQPQRLHYQKLIREISPPSSTPSSSTSPPTPDPSTWRLVAESLPDAGTKSVTSRTITSTPLSPDSLHPFYGGPSSPYAYVSQYLIHGHQFIHNNVVLRVFRVLIPPEGTGALEPLDAPVVQVEECSLKDGSGSWMVSAGVRVEDGGEVGVVEGAVERLIGVKRGLEGVVDLRVGERLSLDSRV